MLGIASSFPVIILITYLLNKLEKKTVAVRRGIGMIWLPLTNGAINTSDKFLARHLRTQNYSLALLCILLPFSVRFGHIFAFIGSCLHFFYSEAVGDVCNWQALVVCLVWPHISSGWLGGTFCLLLCTRKVQPTCLETLLFSLNCFVCGQFVLTCGGEFLTWISDRDLLFLQTDAGPIKINPMLINRL